MVVTVNLPKPYSKQKEILDDGHRFKVLSIGRRSGKSVLCQIASVKAMLKGEYVCYITPQYSLAKDFYKEILKILPESILKTFNATDLFIELITGGTIKFFSGEVLDGLRGRKYHLMIIDEAAYIPDLEHQWNSSMRPTLTDFRGSAIFASTPNGKNYFFSLYTKGSLLEDGYKSWQFSTYENPHIDKQEIDDARSMMPASKFRQEYLAEPMENADNPFGTIHVSHNTLTQLSYKPTLVFGIDIAGLNNDYTVFTGLDEDGRMSYFERFRSPWEVTFSKIKALPSNIRKVIDATGIGNSFYGLLQTQVMNLTPFTFTTETKPKLMYELINDVEQGNVKFNQVTADEMLVFKYKQTPTGHYTFNAQSGFNDDTITALALANHYRKKEVGNQGWKLYNA